MNLVRFILTVLALGSAACHPATVVEPPDPPGAIRVLFIGNSLTYVNDLPGVVAALAAGGGGPPIGAHTVAYPDFALEDHWAEGTAVRRLRNEHWAFVVMQQGPSSLPENQVNLRTWAVQFEPLIRAAGATPALYMVWPSAARSQDFDAVRDSYAAAAVAVHGIFLPAGDAWREAWRRDPTLGLYGGDGFHPSSLGTLLAAYTIYERITGRSAIGLPTPSGIPGATVQLLQEAAHATNARSQ
jgi:hypothetical protein